MHVVVHKINVTRHREMSHANLKQLVDFDDILSFTDHNHYYSNKVIYTCIPDHLLVQVKKLEELNKSCQD
jgi:predicted transcriptional regulator